ncbi:hypothetical protein DNTS_027457, partial [Danionella cerebrum]
HQSGFCMICVMQNHIIQAFANTGNAIKPVSFIRDLKKIARHFRFGSQEDAHEFLRYTVDAMQKACLNGYPKLDRQTQATTLVHQIFGGYLRSRVKCSICKSVSDTYDPYLDIALEIRQAANIVRALELFVKPDVLSGENAYMCAKCKKKVPATKRFTIHRASNVLTLSLKRFANFSGGKITKDVGYPEFLDVRPYMSQSTGDSVKYGLYAVLVHSGYSCHAGHYYCYVKASNGQWYQMNDSMVHSSNIKVVLNQQAYVLFYLRIPEKKNTETSSAKQNMVHSGGGNATLEPLKKSTLNGPLSSPQVTRKLDPAHLRKIQSVDGGLGLPVARSSSGLQSPKLSNGTASALTKTPPGPTMLEEPTKKLKKSIPPSQSRSALPKPQVQSLPSSTSLKSLSDSSSADTSAGSRESVGIKSAPAGNVSGVSAPASPGKSPEEQKGSKLKPLALTNISSEPISTMSPPPAKRLALSAKKASPQQSSTKARVPSSSSPHLLKSPPSALITKDQSPLKCLEGPAHALCVPSNGVPPPCSQTPTLSLNQSHLSPSIKKKKRKKLKRAHTEVEPDAPNALNLEKTITEKQRKKRKREKHGNCVENQKRKAESHQFEEDWCLGETWSLSTDAQRKSLEKQSKTPSENDPVYKKKKKKKKKHGLPEQREVLRNGDTISEGSRATELVGANMEELPGNNKKKKKKKEKLKEFKEENERPNAGVKECVEDIKNNGVQSLQIGNSDKKKASTAAVIVWDGKLHDGFKPRQVPAGAEEQLKKHVGAPVSWDGKRKSDVVQELLRNSSDRAYGSQVLSWEGDVSAISRDAITDARCAKNTTVVDDWDAEFDSGKTKKVKKYRPERRRSGNVFQKIQEHRSLWSVTPGAWRSSLASRHSKVLLRTLLVSYIRILKTLRYWTVPQLFSTEEVTSSG